jgi:CheY-like chemotaxis protein
MNGSVLIIDDDSAFRFAMAKALRRGGYAVTEASSGEEPNKRGQSPFSKG